MATGLDRGTRDRMLAGLLDQAERLLQKMSSECLVYSFAGRTGQFRSATLDSPDARAQADLARGVAMLVGAALRLGEAAGSDTDDVRSMLGNLDAALQTAYDDMHT